MASPAQIAANQANAQKSTGPRSAEGKSASRFNALRHGIDAKSVLIPGEEVFEYNELAANYDREYRPRTASEMFHVAAMLRADWQKCRLECVEADLTRILLEENPGKSLATALLSESPAAKLLARTQRQIASFERTWHRADTALRRSRREIEDAHLEAIKEYVTAPLELASFPQMPQPPKSVKPWPPITEKTRPPLL